MGIFSCHVGLPEGKGILLMECFSVTFSSNNNIAGWKISKHSKSWGFAMPGISFFRAGFYSKWWVKQQTAPTCLKVMCFYKRRIWHTANSTKPSGRLDQQIVVVEFMRRKLAFVFKELQVKDWAKTGQSVERKRGKQKSNETSWSDVFFWCGFFQIEKHR